ncbi:MAG: NAD(P)/FAD-dependent oxidoreductase, partial [Fusobacteriaceae bacterium]
MEKILILGGGAAGVYAAESARKLNKEIEIEILEKESFYPYYRPLISDYLYKEIAETKLNIKPEPWFKENNIIFSNNTEIMGVDLKNKSVLTSKGENKHFDKLIIASGARCNFPMIKNNHLEGIFLLRGKLDAIAIKSFAKTCKKAVVVGGGVLGLEIACGLKELNLEVSVVEIMQRILPRQLDERGSEFLEEKILESGVNLYKNSLVLEYLGKDKIERILLDRDRILETDLVIISAGIIPNKEIFQNTDIFSNRGILVNEQMETTIKDVYACGDVAEYKGKVAGLWDTGVEQGKVAGANAAGTNVVFKEKIQPLLFQGMNTSLISIGNVHMENGRCDSLEDMDYCESSYKKFLFKDKIVEGGLLIGNTEKSLDLIKGVRNSLHKKEFLLKI